MSAADNDSMKKCIKVVASLNFLGFEDQQGEATGKNLRQDIR